MTLIIFILIHKILVKIMLLCHVNPNLIFPPRTSSPSSSSLRGSVTSPPQSPAASHTSQCCICSLIAKNSPDYLLPSLVTTATFRYEPQIDAYVGRKVQAIL